MYAWHGAMVVLALLGGGCYLFHLIRYSGIAIALTKYMYTYVSESLLVDACLVASTLRRAVMI